MQYNVTFRTKDKGIQMIISYKDNNGVWKQKSKQGFKTQKEAKAQLDDIIKELEQKLKNEFEGKINLDYTNLNFKEFTDIVIEHEKLYKEAGTILNYGICVERFKGIHGIKMNKITTLNIQRCIDDLVKDEYAASTIEFTYRTIKYFFNQAIKPYKVLSESPVQDIKLPEKKNKEENEKTALTEAETTSLLSILESTNKKYYTASTLAVRAGLRLGEIVGLTWNNIDLEKGLIHVKQQWKLRKDGTYGFGTLKSPNSYRTVFISKKTVGVLEMWKKKTITRFDNRLFDYTIPNNLGSYIAKKYRSFGFDISIHELRHTYATKLIANGIDLKTASKLLGHDMEQTQKIYAHINKDMLSKAADLIENIF